MKKISHGIKECKLIRGNIQVRYKREEKFTPNGFKNFSYIFENILVVCLCIPDWGDSYFIHHENIYSMFKKWHSK